MLESPLYQEFNSDYLRALGIHFGSYKISMAFLAEIQEELQVRVGSRISEGVSEDKLKLLDEAGSSKEKAAEWLKTYRPDYQEIINHCKCELHYEILHYREKIPGVESLDPLPYLNMDIHELDLSVRATHALERSYIETVGDLISCKDFSHVAHSNRLPPRSVHEIMHKLWILYFPNEGKI